MGKHKNNDKSHHKVNRKYKDSVFTDLFSIGEQTRGDVAISLYNALHNKKITNKDSVEFIRLQNVLFNKVRNDVSFIVDSKLIVLVEHQSTINDNMPLRFLEYVNFIFQAQLEPHLKFSRKMREVMDNANSRI